MMQFLKVLAMVPLIIVATVLLVPGRALARLVERIGGDDLRRARKA